MIPLKNDQRRLLNESDIKHEDLWNIKSYDENQLVVGIKFPDPSQISDSFVRLNT